MSAAISFSWGSSLSSVVHFIRAALRFPRLLPPSKKKKIGYSHGGAPSGAPLVKKKKEEKKEKRGGVRRTRGDVEPCCLRSMSCGRTTQPRLANITVPVFCRWVACHRRLCNSTYDLKQKRKMKKKNIYAEGLKRSNLPIECAARHKDLMFDAFFVDGLLAHLCGSAHSMSTPLHEFGFWPFLLRCCKDYTCTLRSLEVIRRVAFWIITWEANWEQLVVSLSLVVFIVQFNEANWELFDFPLSLQSLVQS